MAFEKVGVRAVIEGITAFNRDARLINRRLKEVTGNVQKLEKESRSLSASLKTLSPGFKKAGLALTGLAVAGGAFLVKATMLAARVETLGVVTEVLGKNVGKTKDEIRALEKAVTDQGITMRAARTSIALMIQSNIDLSNAVDLAAEAQNAAVIAGVDSSEAFRRLVFTITSGNVRMARTLGLQVSFQEAYEKTAESLGKTTLELTQQEKVQARTAEVLKAGTRIVGAYDAAMETAGKKVTSLTRHIENVTVIMGEQFIPLFGDAVDALTAFLEGIEDASKASQSGAAATIAASTAVAGLSGATLLFLSLLPSLIAGLQKIGIATLSTVGIVGLLVTALAGLAVTGARAAAENKILRTAFKDLAREAARNSETFREYERRAFEAAEGTIAFEGAQRLAERTGKSFSEALRIILREQGLLIEEQFDAVVVTQKLAEEAASADRKFFAMGESAKGAADGVKELAEAEKEAADEADRLALVQETLSGQLDKIQLQIDTDITPQFEGFKDEVADLNKQIEDLELERIEAIAELEAQGAEDLENLADKTDELNRRRSDQIIQLKELRARLELAREQLQGMGDDTDELARKSKELAIERLVNDIKAQERAVADLRAELGELAGGSSELAEQQAADLTELESTYADKMGAARQEVEDTTQAWSDQTKEILFNLATQQLALGGFTGEELQLLRKLAGPEGLGLIDEAGVALLEFLDDVNTTLQAPGNQVPEVQAAMEAVFQAMVDPEQRIEQLTDRILGIGSALREVAQEPLLRDLIERGLIPAATLPTRDAGGSVRRGQPYRVGGTGEEIFIPNQSGVIIPHNLSGALTSFLTAATSAIPIAGAGSANVAAGGGGTTQNYNMTINSQARSEQIAADFNLLALMGERRA